MFSPAIIASTCQRGRRVAPSVGGGGGDSELATLANSMSAGTWAELTTSNLASVILVGGSTGNMLPYQNNGAWDPAHGLAHIIGQDHGFGGLRHVQYDEASNSWSLIVSFGSLGDTGGHGYDHLVCNPNTGDLYFTRYGGAGLARKLYGGSWNLNFANFPASSNITYGACWWSGALTGVDGGAGAVVIHEAAFGQIWAYDVGSADWPIVNDTPPPFSPGYHNVAAYSAVHNCMVYGGGNNESKTIFRWNSNNTQTSLTNAPSGCDIGIQQGTLSEDPVTGNFLLLSQGALWELNPTGSGTWTQQTGSRVPPAGVNTADNTANSVCVIPISTYGVTMVVSADGGSSANVYLYKHA